MQSGARDEKRVRHTFRSFAVRGGIAPVMINILGRGWEFAFCKWKWHISPSVVLGNVIKCFALGFCMNPDFSRPQQPHQVGYKDTSFKEDAYYVKNATEDVEGILSNCYGISRNQVESWQSTRTKRHEGKECSEPVDGEKDLLVLAGRQNK